MKSIAVLVVHHALIAAIGNSQYMFEKVNEFLIESGKKPFFDVKLVGLNKKMKLNHDLITIEVDAVLEEMKSYDLIIIPPMSGDMKTAVSINKKYIQWIHQQYKSGSEIASLCVGAFLLAETGLLQGKECSTHWQTANEFRSTYPDVHLVDDKIITDFNGLYTSGGSNSYWNLLVYLVEKFVNRDMAIRTSKYFEVEMDRDKQSVFMIFEGSKSHGDEAIQLAQQYIETHYQEKITIDQLADLTALGRRTFQRRFKKASCHMVMEYLQKVRVEAAKKSLESNRLTINEVMEKVGYHDPKAFRDVFKKVAGIPPLAYRHRYS